jgi:PncC family amidohydrolase
LLEDVVGRLIARGETLALAESCTGGLLSAQLTALPGVSIAYMGSIVAYSNSAKEKFLDVPAYLLKSIGAVSLPVAQRMAAGARQAFASTWALSITGIAGPGGGSASKPVGTVCFAVAGPAFVECEQMFFVGSRAQVQAASAEHALHLLLRQL